MREKLRRRVRSKLLTASTRAAAVLPPAAIASVLAPIASLARFSRFERIALSNLELVLGESTTARERRRIAAGVRRHAARLFAEWIRMSRSSPPDTSAAARGAWIDDAVDVDASVEILARELARGRGALVVTAHIGNWELLAARLARMGHRGAVIGYRRPNDPSSAWLARMRAACGVATLDQDSDPREILAILRRGEVIGLVCDLEVKRLDGEFVPFFGRPAFTMTAPAALARAHAIPLLPAWCVRVGERYSLRFEEPLDLDPELPRRQARTDLLARVNGVFERWIRAAPEQWAWHQPRWRTAPGEHRSMPLAARIRETRAARLAAGLPVRDDADRRAGELGAR